MMPLEQKEPTNNEIRHLTREEQLLCRISILENYICSLEIELNKSKDELESIRKEKQDYGRKKN